MSVLNNISISTKLILFLFIPLLIISVLIYAGIYFTLNDLESYMMNETEKMLMNKHKQELKSVTEVGISVILSVYNDPDIPEEMKFNMAASHLRGLEFGTDGYYFVYENGTGKNLIHGGNSNLEGVNLWEFQDPNDPQFMIQELDRVANEGSLFHQYYWTKRDTDTTHPKLGTAQLIPGTNMWIGTGTYLDEIETELQVVHDSVVRKSNERLQPFIIGFIAYLLIALLFIIRLSRSFTRPINSATTFATAMAGGDLSVSLAVEYDGKNEIGMLIGSLNQMKSNFWNMVNSLQEVSAKLLTSSDQINNSVTSMNQFADNLVRGISGIEDQIISFEQSVDHTKQSSDDINTFINKLTELIVNQASALTESTASIEQMSLSIQNIAKSTDEKFLLARELESRAQKGVSEMQVTTGIIKEMAESANVMMDMIAVINNITTQTNLLAMNASIEAAHAGEAGKGFAVVANEILKLAKDTSANAKQISDSLKNTMALISNSKKSITNTEQLFDNLVVEIKGLASSMTEMKNHSQELATGSTQITYALGDIMSITENVKESSSTALEKVGTIDGHIDKLVNDFTKTKDGLEIIVSSTQELSQHIVHVQTIGENNSGIVSSLDTTVVSFNLSEEQKKKNSDEKKSDEAED